VSIDFSKDGMTVQVKDDGKGFVIGEDLRFVEAGKIGLAGMQERADLLGGNLSIQSNVGRRYAPLRCWFPTTVGKNKTAV